MKIRNGTEADIQACLAIYNYEVQHGVATLDLTERTLSEWRVWFREHHQDNHIVLVAVDEVETVLGYATLSAYRVKEAFKSTVELSIYVHPEHRQQGVATALMEAVVRLAQADERTHLVVSVITSGNQASIALHHRFGFTFAGTIPEVGYKKGSMQGIDHYWLRM